MTYARKLPFLLLALAVTGFVTVSVPRYLTFDPARSRIPPPEQYPFYYPVLVTHVLCGTVAILSCLFQVWPWFREHHRRAHRRIGRAYVAGVWFAGLAALVLGVVTPFGPVLRVSDVTLALLWLSVTTYGFLLARRGRYAEHRRWMLRSFALTVSIVVNRIVGIPIALLLIGRLDTTFAGNATWMVATIAGLTGWVSWTLVLLIVEGWLEHDTRRRAGRGAQVVAVR